MYTREDLMEMEKEDLIGVIEFSDSEHEKFKEQHEQLIEWYKQEVMKAASMLNQFRDENLVLLRKVVIYQENEI